MTTVPLPSNVSYGKVEGQFLLAVADASDADTFPDGVPATGYVQFDPDADFLADPTAAPVPVTLTPFTVTGTLDANGYLTGPGGQQGVWLIATNDPDLPANWAYNVSLFIDGIPFRTVRLTVPSGGTVNLGLALV